jgi:Ca-activated chloride channel family protein
MTFDPNDPRLTAYVLGELDPAEAESVEKLLGESDECRQAVEEIRLTVGWLVQQLHDEQEAFCAKRPVLNHQLVTANAPNCAGPTKPWWFRHRARLGGAAAAAIVLSTGMTWFFAIMPRRGPARQVGSARALKSHSIVATDAGLDAVAARREALELTAPATVVPLVDSPASPAQVASLLTVADARHRDAALLQGHARRRRSIVLALADHTGQVAFGYSLAKGTRTLGVGGENNLVPNIAENEQLRNTYLFRTEQGMGAGMMGRGLQEVRQAQQAGYGPQPDTKTQVAFAGPSQRGASAQATEPLQEHRAGTSGGLARGHRAAVHSPTPSPPPAAFAPPGSSMMAGAAPAPAMSRYAAIPARTEAMQGQLGEAPELSLAASERAGAAPKVKAKARAQATIATADNPFLPARAFPVSMLPADSDTIGYAEVRRALARGELPPGESVRIEELLNYFPSHEVGRSGKTNEPFRVQFDVAGCPWNARNRLARIGIAAPSIDQANRPACNLVFLVAVSDSMRQPNKLPLLQWSLARLIEELEPRDRVAVVACGETPGVVLASTSCREKSKIREAIDDLRVEASGDARSSIAQAYDLARGNLIDGGRNRVVVATDVGTAIETVNPDEANGLIEERASSGISLSCLGLGSDPATDKELAGAALRGRGRFAHVDAPGAAYQFLLGEIGSTLAAIASDLRASIELNADRIGAYRLIGFDRSSGSPREEYIDDTKDARAVFAGHRLTALYELAPAEGLLVAAKPVQGSKAVERIDPWLLSARLHFRIPNTAVDRVIEYRAPDRGTDFAHASADMRAAAAVSGFGMLLRGSPFKATLNYDGVLQMIAPLCDDGHDRASYYRDFAELVRKARAISQKAASRS